MKSPTSLIIYKYIDKAAFQVEKNAWITLYLDAFTSGELAQCISEKEAENSLNDLVEKGRILAAYFENQLAGCVIYFPFNQHTTLSISDFPNINFSKTAYIAELMVKSNFRKKGIATTLLDKSLVDMKRNYENAAIRVWDKNKKAIYLYEKKGFVPFTTIVQTKKRSETETFPMRKIYMIKNF